MDISQWSKAYSCYALPQDKHLLSRAPKNPPIQKIKIFGTIALHNELYIMMKVACNAVNQISFLNYYISSDLIISDIMLESLCFTFCFELLW